MYDVILYNVVVLLESCIGENNPDYSQFINGEDIVVIVTSGVVIINNNVPPRAAGTVLIDT